MTVIKKLLLGMGWLFAACSLYAQVVMDGTLGAPGNLSGPDFQISSDLGQQKGGNLFHSFSQFNVNTGETATFAGPESMSNILARVTGGQSSFIDGTLRSTISKANLYLLNPSGILFGENARLDISGSFHASTADYVNLGEEGHFYASVGHQSVLTVAPPSAFGFLDNQAAPISIQGSFLKTSEGNTLSLSGGDISIEEGVLFASDGEISIRAERLFIKNSQLYAQGVRGGNLTINAPIFALDNSWLVANSWSGEGGNISISTDRFTLSKNDTIILSSGLSMNGRPLDISLEKAEQLITGNRKLSSLSYLRPQLSLSSCANFSKENQSRFIITAREILPFFPEDLEDLHAKRDIPQETPYDLQTHWVLPGRGRRGK